jgi:hypothetical protein
MPTKSCISKGRKGYRWGNHGKCYIGKGAKKRANRQGRAAYASGYKGKR